MRRYLFALIGLPIMLCVAAPAQVLKVPLTFPTIGAALQVAGSGQTILVSGGVYQENITWPAVDGIRLVGIEGAVIDGGRNGRVITVGSGLTRATVIEGFTIRGGLAKDGAGVHLQSSIVLRGNTITACEGTDATLNRGAGVFVATGASPRIVLNTIFGNTLRNGATNQGAGVFVDTGTRAEIVANVIRANACQGPGASYGAGIYFVASGVPAPLLADNLIAQNVNQGATLAMGGGVHVDGGTVDVTGNTVADNRCTSTTRATGGGIGFDRTNGAASRMRNNLVVRNQCTGALQIGGGVHCNNANISFDYNNVWQNTPDDYFGCAPGANDRSIAPQFSAPGSYELSLVSPLVDAGDDSAVDARSSTDPSGDPRRLDGDRDGATGNGARVDIGADEAGGVAFTMTGWLGESLVLDVASVPGLSFAVAVSFARANVLVQPFGSLLIGNPVVIGGGASPGSVRVPLPRLPALEGLTLHAQGLVYGTRPAVFGELTERRSLVLVERFSRPIVESFASRRQFDTGDASWGLGRGLGATYGFGGTGVDGPLVVTGTMTLDGDLRPAGTHAEWDFQSLTIATGATLTITGGRSARLKVAGNCVVDGTIDVSGRNGGNATPGRAMNVGPIPGGRGGPGGGAGGVANPKPNAPIGALPVDLRGLPGYPKALRCTDLNKSDNRLVTIVEPNCGGGMGGNRGIPSGATFRPGCSGNGGGHAGDGEQTDFSCGRISSFGREFGVRWIVPSGPGEVAGPTSGTGGGGGGNCAIQATNPLPTDDIVAGAGGGGGGGLEITALGTITVRGSILSDGGNGGTGHTTVVNGQTLFAGYGGGGAGGSIWLSGTAVNVDNAAVLSAVGGIGHPMPPNPPRTGNGGPGYIIVRDLPGTPTIAPGATVNPAPVAGRASLALSGMSSATSKWYTATIGSPVWAFNASNPQTGVVIQGSDLLFGTRPTTGQQVKISFQGAPDVNGMPNPNPTTWVPQNGFTNNITQLAGLRHVRYKIEFDLGQLQAPPLPSLPAISRLTLRY